MAEVDRTVERWVQAVFNTDELPGHLNAEILVGHRYRENRYFDIGFLRRICKRDGMRVPVAVEGSYWELVYRGSGPHMTPEGKIICREDRDYLVEQMADFQPWTSARAENRMYCFFTSEIDAVKFKLLF